MYILKLQEDLSDYDLEMETVASEIYKSFSISDCSLTSDGREDNQEITRNKKEF